jgi:hypothetical protein
MSDDREARIRDRAYQIWMDEGRPEGRDHDHWLRAKNEVEGEVQKGQDMLQAEDDHKIGKPERGTVVPDHRPFEEPANKSEEPPPVHAEKEAAHTGSDLDQVGKTSSAAAGKGKAKAAPKRAGAAGTDAEKAVPPAAAPRGRKPKAKSSSMEPI